MRVLAVDTSSESGSTAVVEDGVVRGEVRLRAHGGHSHHVLPAVAFLYQSLSLQPDAIDAFAVVIGPGSFTGLRIGISTIQGLALASGRSCVGLSTLDVLAERVKDQGDELIALLDAHRSQVFAARYDREGRRLTPPRAASIDMILDEAAPRAVFVGNGALRYRERIQERLPESQIAGCDLFLAGTLGLMAAARIGTESVAPAELHPVYLREADVGQGR